MEPKRLCRASIDKKICGVCGGIAHYFDVDSNLIRLITAALVLAGGLSVWLYIIAAIILPETDAFYITSKKSGTLCVPDFYGSSDEISGCGRREIFRQDKVWKMAECFAYPQRACPHPYGSFVANGYDIFPIFRTVGLAEKNRRPRSGFYSEVPCIFEASQSFAPAGAK